MIRVILESPYKGDVERNVRYARMCVMDSLSRGEAPIASHLLYTQEGILKDEVPEERRIGIDAGLAWKSVAQKHVFYIDYGYSEGMEYAKRYAIDHHIEVEERKIFDDFIWKPRYSDTDASDKHGRWARICYYRGSMIAGISRIEFPTDTAVYKVLDYFPSLSNDIPYFSDIVKQEDLETAKAAVSQRFLEFLRRMVPGSHVSADEFCTCDNNGSDLYTASVTKCGRCKKQVNIVRVTRKMEEKK